MMGNAYWEDGVLPENGECDSASTETDASRISGGSFSLRRAHYFNDIWHEKIISHNLRIALVDNIAMHYVDRGMALSDLIKEGNLGLTHALENFEFEGGSRFSTYAARCVRQSIERAIARRVPVVSKITPALVDSYPLRRGVSGNSAKKHLQAV